MTMPSWNDPFTKKQYPTRPWWYPLANIASSVSPKEGWGQWGKQLLPSPKPVPAQKTRYWSPLPSGTPSVTPKPYSGFGYTNLFPEESQSNAGFSPEYTQKLGGIQSKQSILNAIYPLASQTGMNKYDLDRMTGILGVAIEDLDVNDLMAILNELKQRTSQPEETGGLTPQQRATYEKQQAVQRRAGGTPDTDQADALRKAQSMGVDTSEAEASLGSYPGNERKQQRAFNKLHMAMKSQKVGQQMLESKILAQEYPEWYNKYTKTLGKGTPGAQFLNVGGTIVAQAESHPGMATARGIPGISQGSLGGPTGGNWALQGFSDWAQRTPEFKEAIVARETQMLTDYPQVYPWYQQYVSGFTHEDYRQGDLPLPFTKWLKTEPLAQAYLESQKPKPVLGMGRAPEWATARQR